jgi:hypothetical protein
LTDEPHRSSKPCPIIHAIEMRLNPVKEAHAAYR